MTIGIVIKKTEKYKKQKTHSVEWVLWYLQGSNQGHMDFQSIALPSELRYRACCGCKYIIIFGLCKTFFRKNLFVSSQKQKRKYDFNGRCWQYQN